MTLFTEEALRTADMSNWGFTPASQGCFRQLGIRSGPPLLIELFVGGTSMTMPETPNMQNHTQVFIKGNLGSPGLVQGPRGGQDILRRVVVTAPQLALNLDQAGTHYVSIRIPPGTIS